MDKRRKKIKRGRDWPLLKIHIYLTSDGIVSSHTPSSIGCKRVIEGDFDKDILILSNNLFVWCEQIRRIFVLGHFAPSS